MRDNVVEDIALAQLIKRQRLRLRLADGNRLIACRMYESWDEVRDGFAKNLLAGHGNSIPFLIVSTIFHWLVFVYPWIWWLWGGGWWAAGLIVGGVGLRLGTAVFTRTLNQKYLLSPLLMPLSVLLMTRIAAQSISWKLRGDGQWKGRKIAISEQ